MSSATGTTLYFPGSERLISTDRSVVRHRHYIATPEGVIGTVDQVEGTGTFEERYWLKDHLGSIVATVPSAADTKVAQLGYTVWGERTAAQAPAMASTQRGFTGHETLDEVGLVHMNGRLYDPAIGKFISADPIVQAPLSGQSYNRYAYVMNNPLSATDPSGYSSRWVQWRRPIGAIAVAAFLGPGGYFGAQGVLGAGGMGLLAGDAAVFGSATAAGFAAGGIGGGNLESALWGAFFAAINYEIGSVLPGKPSFADMALNVVGHAVVGCLQQATAGGSCRAGSIAGGFSAASGFAWEKKGFAEGLARSVVVGAVASRLSGDSAQNGALTAAFEYLFNHAAHEMSPDGRTTETICHDCSSPGVGRSVLGDFFPLTSAADRAVDFWITRDNPFMGTLAMSWTPEHAPGTALGLSGLYGMRNALSVWHLRDGTAARTVVDFGNAFRFEQHMIGQASRGNRGMHWHVDIPPLGVRHWPHNK